MPTRYPLSGTGWRLSPVQSLPTANRLYNQNDYITLRLRLPRARALRGVPSTVDFMGYVAVVQQYGVPPVPRLQKVAEFSSTTTRTHWANYEVIDPVGLGAPLVATRQELIFECRQFLGISFSHLAKMFGAPSNWTEFNTRNITASQIAAEYRQACRVLASRYALDASQIRQSTIVRPTTRVASPADTQIGQIPNWMSDPEITYWYDNINITTGHELEVVGMRPDGATALLDGMPDVRMSRDTNYRHDTHPNNSNSHGSDALNIWKAIPDGSLPSNSSAEVVSPVTWGISGGYDWEGEHRIGFQTLRAVMLTLRAGGARITARCGGHVHMGVEGLSRAHRARIVEAHYNFQPLFDKFVAQRRRGVTSYCGPRSQYDSQILAQRFSVGVAPGDTPRSEVGSGQRLNLNVSSWIKYGTFELRQFEGTLNPKKMFAWLCLNKAFFKACEEAGTDWVLGEAEVIQDYNRQNTEAMLDRLANMTLMPNVVKELIKEQMTSQVGSGN